MTTHHRRLGAIIAILSMTAILFLAPKAMEAEAHNACEITSHAWDDPNLPHASDFGCSTPLNFTCGSVAEVFVETRFGGFGVADSNGAVQVWATNVVSGKATEITHYWGPTQEVDDRYFRIVTNWHAIRRGASDGAYFSTAFGTSTLRFGCMNNTQGQAYHQSGSY